jgi:DNA-binding FadR family transcriptional regulator
MEKADTGGRKAAVLAVIVDRIARGLGVPSERELSHAVSISRTRVRHYLDQLEREGTIARSGGQRSIAVRSLPDARAQLLAALRDEGWVHQSELGTPGAGYPCPQGHLPMLPELEYLPDVEVGGAGGA